MALAGDAASPAEAVHRFPRDMRPARRLEVLADLVIEIAERASIGWLLYRDAAAVDPEIAADWSELQLLRHQLFTNVIGGIPNAALGSGLTPKMAIDSAWAIASPESFDLLVNRLGYPLDEFRDWLKKTLAATLLSRARRT